MTRADVGWSLIIAGLICYPLLALLDRLLNRLRPADIRPDAGLSILDSAERDNRDDATEEMLLAGMDALRATPPAEDLAGPVVTVAADERPMVAAPWPAIGMRHQRPPVAPWRPAWGAR